MKSPATSELMLSGASSEIAAVVSLLPRVFANIDAALPGFPSSTPGASSSSSAGAEPDGLLPVERLATTPDVARTDQARVHKLIAQIDMASKELRSLATFWGFDRQQGKLDVSSAVTDGWCESHLRIEALEPIDPSKRYARTCRWCGDFAAAEGRPPSADLLLLRASGRRITRRMIEAEHDPRRGRRARGAA